MRKKLRKEVAELKQLVEALEKKLDFKSDALFEQRKLIDFLCQHDKDDVVIHNVGSLYPMGTMYMCGYELSNTFEVEYLSCINLMRVKIVVNNCNEVKIISNDKERIVVKAIDAENEEKFRCFRITKHNGDITEVTEYYQKTTTDDKSDTPTETDFKYFTAEQVRKMSQSEVKANYSDLRKSMELG